MHVVFIHPECESLGVEYLAASLRQAGHIVSLIFDPVLYQGTMSIRKRYNPALAHTYSMREIILDRVERLAPDLIAFSVLTAYYQWAKKLAADIKKNIPQVPIIFGGIHSTSVPEVVLRDPSVDFICVGEGEEALVDLATALERKEPVGAIPNIWYRNAEGGLVINEIRNLRENLDEIPFPEKSIFYEYLPRNIGYTLITGRGCLFRCSFCSHSVSAQRYKGKGRLLRRRSVANVMGEIRRAETLYNKPFYIFDDDILTYDGEWLDSFSALYASEVNKPTFAWVEPSTLTPAIADALSRMRCFAVEMGVQNINEEYRNRIMRRTNTNEQIKKAITILKDRGIEVIVDNMVGCPQETLDDIRQLVDFYSENRPHRVFVFFLRYYPRVDIIKYSGLTDEQVGLFEEGEAINSFLLPADAAETVEKTKLVQLLRLVHLLPRRLVKLVLRKRLYRFFPVLRIEHIELVSFILFCLRQTAKGRDPCWFLRPATTVLPLTFVRRSFQKKCITIRP